MNLSGDKIFMRSQRLFSKEGLSRLHRGHVAVFGLGGVGGHAVEALARAGVGKLTIVDGDIVDVTNMNRQIIATKETLGNNKAEMFKKRIENINPECIVQVKSIFFNEETADKFDFQGFDYAVDAIDSFHDKIHLILRAKKMGIPIISSTGMGNRMDPTLVKIEDIYNTNYCPLAKKMRKALKEHGIPHLDVAWSSEIPIKSSPPSSTPFVPAASGIAMAGRVVKEMISE